jgi:arylsulfatase A
VHNWRSLEGKVSWQINTVAAGDYHVKLQYLCPKPNGGSKIEVSVGTHKQEITVPTTDYIQIPSPDRVPRKEAYEMIWQWLDLGSVPFPAGPTTLQVKATELKGEEVMELKAVWIEKK